MKTILLPLSLILTTSLLSVDELSWVNEQVQAIKPPRVGVRKSEISHIKNPFVFLKKNRIEEEETTETPKKTTQATKSFTPVKTKHINKVLSLDAIINKSVLISGEWYKLGDSINGFTLKEISRNSVLLKKKNKELLLTTKSHNNSKLKFHK